MSIIKAIKTGWKAKTPVEKFKFVMNLVCSLGTGAICGDTARRLMPGHNKIEQVAMSVAAFGVGGYLGDKAGDYIGETTDAVVTLYHIHKDKEDNANA